MSVAPPGAPPAPGTIACPRCATLIGPDQDWCLECGAPARTRLVPTPNWRAPVAVLAVVVLLAGVALAVAFVSLTNDTEPAAPVNSQAPPPSATSTAPAAPAPTQPAPTTAAPTTATTAPGTATGQGTTATQGTATGQGTTATQDTTTGERTTTGKSKSTTSTP